MRFCERCGGEMLDEEPRYPHCYGPANLFQILVGIDDSRCKESYESILSWLNKESQNNGEG